jgi:hypothetical protein
VWSRDLQDGRVVQGADPVYGARLEVERRAGADDLGVRDRIARRAHLQLHPPCLDVPRLVLLPVELEAERVACANEQDLADVVVRVGPDQLVAPGLLDTFRLDRPGVEAVQVG